MSKKEHGDGLPFDKDGNIDYHKWMQINAFIKKLHDMHYLEQANEAAKEAREFFERRNAYLQELDMIDQVVDMMDEYPEAEFLISKIMRRIDNDKKY